MGELLIRRLAAATAAGLALTTVLVIAAATGAHPAAPSHVRAVLAASTGAWTVYHHDNAHTGYDSTQPAATTAAAGWTSSAFDGSIYAEPLVYNGIVYAVTLHGTVYAINQSTGVTAWSLNVGVPQSVLSGQCGNINPLGISGTPVIDAAAGRIYVAEALAADQLWHVFGIDLTTHMVVMNTSIPTNLGAGFDWTIEQERGALGLANGNVYVPFGGRIGDCGAYHGWIFAVPTSGAALTNYYQTPGQGAGFWSTGGVVIDDSTGKVFETSGNGTSSGCNQASPGGPPVYENDAVVRLSATLAHEDAFIPQDWYGSWCINDQDLGSATMVLINPTLAFQAGKWGNGFLVNPQALGGQGGQVYPTPKPAAYSAVDVCRGNHNDANFGSYAYAAPYVYLGCEGNGLVALSVDTTAKSFSSCGASCSSPSWNAGGFRPGPPIVAGGAVWAVDTNGGGLYGFNATTGAQIYHSAGFGVTHFTSPSEAGGQIFVGSGNIVRSFNMVTGCSTVTLGATPMNSAPAGSTVTLSANATGPNCISPQYQFWMRPAAGSWTMIRDYNGTSTFGWTSTASAGGYYLGVYARALASTAPFESIASIPYTLTATSCTGASVSPASATVAQGSGAHDLITGVATGCVNAGPLYEFWIRSETSAWYVAQSYSTSATMNWNTTGAPAGKVYLGLWVKDAGSATSTFDANASTLVTVTTSACTGASVSAASPTVTGGAHDMITGVATGCTNAGPLYEFWIRSETSAWYVAQPFSTSATMNWNSAGAPVGKVYLGLWVKDAGSSTSTFDANASTFVTVS